MSERVCKGCGAPLASNKGPSRPRIWCSDRCRKRQYDLVCIECGGRVDGTTPSKVPNLDEPVCIRCAAGHYAIWTREAIVCAIQEWADEHGGIPPAATDWLRARARNDSRVTSVTNVQKRFGTWNAAIRAAGFEPHSGGYRREIPAEVRSEAVRRYAAGESSVSIAADLDCSPQVVLRWARAADVPIHAPFQRKAAA